MSQNYPTLPLVQLPMPKQDNLPANLSEILPINQANNIGNVQQQNNQSNYNPQLLRQILSEIQSGKNLGLPELAGDQRNATLQQLLGQQQIQQPVQQQALPEMGSVYDNGQGQIMQNPTFNIRESEKSMKNNPLSWGRILGSGATGLLFGGPIGAISGALSNAGMQKKGDLLRDIYKEAGFDVPADLNPELVPNYIKNQLAIRKEGRDQQTANLSFLNSTLDANKKMIEQSTLPEKTKAELYKLQSEAIKSGSEAKYAEAYQKGRLALQGAQTTAYQAMTPYRIAQTNKALAQTDEIGSTGSLKPLSSTSAEAMANSLQGIDSVKGLSEFIGKKKELLFNVNSRLSYERQKDAINDILRRMRTGAAINAAEEKFYLQQVPTIEDFTLFPEQAEQKIELFNKLFSDKIKGLDPQGQYVQNMRGKSLDELMSKPQQQSGYADGTIIRNAQGEQMIRRNNEWMAY